MFHERIGTIKNQQDEGETQTNKTRKGIIETSKTGKSKPAKQISIPFATSGETQTNQKYQNQQNPNLVFAATAEEYEGAQTGEGENPGVRCSLLRPEALDRSSSVHFRAGIPNSRGGRSELREGFFKQLQFYAELGLILFLFLDSNQTRANRVTQRISLLHSI